MTKLALVGATASGKTAVGVALIELLDGEIVSADSVQVYKQLDIGSAKPTADERSRAVFHGIDLVEPDADWTLADYQAMGEAAIAHIVTRGRAPLIVGGTGLYIRALTSLLGIPSVPPDAEFRERWQAFAREQGNPALHAEVAKVDADAAARIHVNDVGRLVRALEVFDTTGVPLSEWHRRDRERQNTDTDLIIFGLDFPDRRVLYERIERRVDAMLTAGFVEEVQGLLASGYGPDLKSMQSLGYRHVCAFLSGDMTLPDAVDLLKRDTRRFARRQLIWFRADPRIVWLPAEGKTADALAQEIAVHVL